MHIDSMHIVLTGASGGIGRACARQLAERGARINAVGRNSETLERLLATLPEHPDGHRYLVADLNQQPAIERLKAQLTAMTPAPNSLINMAGINDLCLFERQDADRIRQMIDTNVIATLLTTQALLPLLRQQASARIVNIGSSLGSIGYPGYVSYCTSKFALRGFSEALARELSDTPVKVQYLAPRATATDLNSDAANALNQALGNAVDSPEQVAQALIRLLETRDSQRYLGWPEKLFVRLNGLLPDLVSRAIGKQLATVKQHASHP